jgi:hypothetical protein
LPWRIRDDRPLRHAAANGGRGRSRCDTTRQLFYLADAVPLDVTVLRQRYQEELRPYLGNPAREDLTMDLWVEAIEERRGIPGRAKDR